jgi:protein O-mannosyl-transferase
VPEPPLAVSHRARALAVAALLTAGTLLLYARVASFGFLHVDDDRYVTDNPWVRRGLSWDGLAWAATTLDVSNWHPLTWLSHMLDVQLFGLAPGAHHLVSAVLHAVNVGLLFLALLRMTGATGRSAFVAAVFAAHPLHVESVAWVSERKDLLSTLFGLLMLLAYASYAARPAWRRYALVVACHAASLLAKPMWVTAPFLLLLLDAWPLGRWSRSPPGPDHPAVPGISSAARLVAEKLPLLALSAVSCVMTVIAQGRGGSVVGAELGLGARVANALVSYVRYLGKAFWPSSLAAFYPHPAHGLTWAQVSAAAGLLAVITWVALRAWRAAPWLAVGWLWFLGTLVPVIGLVQVGMQAMADRYMYLPLVGLAVAVAWEGERWARRAGAARALAPAAVLMVAVLAGLAWRQLGFWSDQVNLFRHAVEVTGPNPRARLFLAQGHLAAGAYAEAAAQLAEATRLDPGDPRARKNYGYALFRLGQVDEAIAQLRAAVALDPDYAEAHGNLAIAYGRKGWTDLAMREMAIEGQLRARQAR